MGGKWYEHHAPSKFSSDLNRINITVTLCKWIKVVYIIELKYITCCFLFFFSARAYISNVIQATLSWFLQEAFVITSYVKELRQKFDGKHYRVLTLVPGANRCLLIRTRAMLVDCVSKTHVLSLVWRVLRKLLNMRNNHLKYS